MKSHELENIISLMMCPPGNGVYTVSTAKEFKEKLHEKIYKTTDLIEVQNRWKKAILETLQNEAPTLLGIPLDTGGGIQRGANWGPLFIRNEFIQKSPLEKYSDLGDVRIIPHLLHDKYLNEGTIAACQQALYQGTSLPVSGLSMTEYLCDAIYQHNPSKLLVGLGGDHSVSYPLVRSWLKHKIQQKKKVAVIHFDAHTDLLDHRLGIDLCFGSWAYHILDLLPAQDHLIQLGIRASGKERTHWESNLGIQQFWAKEIQDNFTAVKNQVTSFLVKNQIEEVYVTFDIDALDIDYASATGTPEKGGLAPHHCVQLIESIFNVCSISGADLVEVAPFVRSPYQSKMIVEPETTLLSSYLILQTLISAMQR
jgi:agmatinase